jgi:hypothetical protein
MTHDSNDPAARQVERGDAVMHYRRLTGMVALLLGLAF